MLKGWWRCLKRCPKPEPITFVCILALVYVLLTATNSFVEIRTVEVFNHTGSASQENLEIILCPMPRVYVGRLMHFGSDIPSYLNQQIYFHLALPAIYQFGHRHGIRQVYYKILLCLVRRRLFRNTESLLVLFEKMKLHKECWPEKIRSDDALWEKAIRGVDEFYDRYKDDIMPYLNAKFRTLDESLLEEYTELFDLAWVLPYGNSTLDQLVNFIGVDMLRHLDKDKLFDSIHDVTGPKQKLEHEKLSTRMAPKCYRYAFRKSSHPSYQRSVTTFGFSDHCPEGPPGTYPERSFCLNTPDMYLVVYVSAVSRFTDVPAAGAIVPYRVAVDRQTVMHISVKKRVRVGNCKTYDAGSSHVTCVEDCLFVRLLKKINCTVPWLRRLQVRFKIQHVIPPCVTVANIQRTRKTVQRIFDATSNSETVACAEQCPSDCQELSFTSRLSGSRRSIHGRLQLLVSDRMPVFIETYLYDYGQFISEVMGSLSFIIGVSMVALYDWLIGVVLWVTGKLPFIPAMPPVIKKELYMREICSCAEEEDAAPSPSPPAAGVASDSELAESFRQPDDRARASSVRASEDAVRRPREAARRLGIAFPSIAIRTSGLSTVVKTLTLPVAAEPAPAEGGEQRRRRSSFLEDAFGRPVAAPKRLPLLEPRPRRVSQAAPAEHAAEQPAPTGHDASSMSSGSKKHSGSLFAALDPELVSERSWRHRPSFFEASFAHGAFQVFETLSDVEQHPSKKEHVLGGQGHAEDGSRSPRRASAGAERKEGSVAAMPRDQSKISRPSAEDIGQRARAHSTDGGEQEAAATEYGPSNIGPLPDKRPGTGTRTRPTDEVEQASRATEHHLPHIGSLAHKTSVPKTGTDSADAEKEVSPDTERDMQVIGPFASELAGPETQTDSIDETEQAPQASEHDLPAIGPFAGELPGPAPRADLVDVKTALSSGTTPERPVSVDLEDQIADGDRGYRVDSAPGESPGLGEESRRQDAPTTHYRTRPRRLSAVQPEVASDVGGTSGSRGSPDGAGSPELAEGVDE